MRARARRWTGEHRIRLATLLALFGLLFALVVLTPLHVRLSSAFRACSPAGLEVWERGTDWAFSQLWVVEPHLGGCDTSAGAFTRHGQRWATERYAHGLAADTGS